MANAVVASWTALSKDVQLVVDTAGAQLAVNALYRWLEKLKEQPSLPHAAWKKLAIDVQVTDCCCGVNICMPAHEQGLQKHFR